MNDRWARDKNPRRHLYDLIQPASPAPEASVHHFTFTGDGSEYFYIWLSNLALTVLTLGIYSAWAKVRREQYFCSHTELDGHTFEYTAEPINILKGRIFLLVFLAIAVAIHVFFPIVDLFIAPIAIILAPWLITQSLRFRARYTSYRNIPFRFTGEYDQTMKYFAITKAISYLSFGLLSAWCKYKQKRYVVENFQYGRTKFEVHGNLSGFFKIYFSINSLLVLPLLIGFYYFLSDSAVSAIYNLTQVGFHNFEAAWYIFTSDPSIPLILGFGFALTISWQFLAPTLIQFLISQLTWDTATLGTFEIFHRPPFHRYLWILISNVLLFICTFGMATPFCVVRMRKFKIEHLALLGVGTFSSFRADSKEHSGAIGDQALDLYGLDIDVGF